MNQKIKTEMISRRKALSLLGLGAALGFTLSSALEPLEAEAQEATGTAAAPAEATGTHGMQRRQGRRTGRHERRTHAAHRSACDARRRSPRNSTAIAVASDLNRLTARFDELRIAVSRSSDERDRRRKK